MNKDLNMQRNKGEVSKDWSYSGSSNIVRNLEERWLMVKKWND